MRARCWLRIASAPRLARHTCVVPGAAAGSRLSCSAAVNAEGNTVVGVACGRMTGNGVDGQNRELQIMKQLKHSNVVELKCSFYSKGEKVRCCAVLLFPQQWPRGGLTTALSRCVIRPCMHANLAKRCQTHTQEQGIGVLRSCTCACGRVARVSAGLSESLTHIRMPTLATA